MTSVYAWHHLVMVVLLLLAGSQASASIELEENDVSILNNIVLALLAISSSCFYCCFRAVLLQEIRHQNQQLSWS